LITDEAELLSRHFPNGTSPVKARGFDQKYFPQSNFASSFSEEA
jgi:hypothetical protein